MQRSQNPKGFTLIELLVVIAIIAILAAILFPVFAKVREKARQTTCASNEKQLGLAVIQYNQDYDETMPAIFVGSNTWCTLIDSYVKAGIPGIYHCPSNPNKQYRSDGTPSDYVVNEGGQWDNVNNTVDYGPWHGGAGVYNPSPSSLAPLTLSAIDAPSECISIVEANETSGGPWNINIVYGGQNWLFAGHTGVMNVLFCDGHVKALRPFQTTDAGAGGSAPINYWRTDGKTFGTGTSDPAQLQNGITSLKTAQKKYQ